MDKFNTQPYWETLEHFTGSLVQKSSVTISCLMLSQPLEAFVLFVPSDPSLLKCLIGRPNLLESLQLVLGGRSISITTALSVEELGEAGLRPLAIEVDDGVAARLDQLDGGEALHLDLLQLVGSAVHLSYHNVGVVGILLAQLVPDGCELLAMSAPRGIKLDQYVLLGIHGDLVEVLADQNLHASRVPVLGNLLRHQVLLQLSSQDLGNTGLDILGLDLVILRLVLSHVLSPH